MNPFDILGAVMQAGMSQSSGNRMGDVLGNMMGGSKPANTQGRGQSAPSGGGLFDMLSQVAGGMLGGGQGTQGTQGGGFSPDILKQVAGAVLGGNASQGNAGAGMGSMAVFGSLAAQALEMAKGMMSGGGPTGGMDDQSAVISGMRVPQTPQEQQQVLDMALLTIKAMMNAAKADGQVDEQEKARLLGKLQEGGISAEEQRFVTEEMQKPIDLDGLVRAVPNQQAAAQIYAASLMAIEVDTDPERHYLADLAAKLNLDPNVVTYLHKAVGLS